jgi:hypothetical protein
LNFIRLVQANTTIKNNIFANIVCASAGIYQGVISMDNANGNQYIYNNIIYGNSEGAGLYIWVDSGKTWYVYNNTCIGGTRGIYSPSSSGTVLAKNNLCIGNTTADYGSGIDTMTTCGSGDATGTEGLQNMVAADIFANVTGGSEDLHLKAGAAAIDTGTDLGTGSFSFDIDNRDRDAQGDVWDLGADEYVAVSGAYSQIMMISS